MDRFAVSRAGIGRCDLPFWSLFFPSVFKPFSFQDSEQSSMLHFQDRQIEFGMLNNESSKSSRRFPPVLNRPSRVGNRALTFRNRFANHKLALVWNGGIARQLHCFRRELS